MKISTIESKENSVIKHVVKLAQNRRYREQNNQAIAYGEHLLIEVLRYNLVDKIFVLADSFDKYQKYFTDYQEVYLLNSELITKINLLDSPVDIVAIINIAETPAIDFNADSLILENIQDAGNLGTILRVAKASGISQVLLSQNSVDIYNPKVLRASQGIQLGLAVICNCNLLELLPRLNLQILALTPYATNSLYACDLIKKTAFVLGNEGSGISQQLLSIIDKKIIIPMLGDTESINLAMAATVAAFELSRQRTMRIK